MADSGAAFNGHGSTHLHITVADSSGAEIGGHLCVGSLVRTTSELVIGLLPEWRFSRQLDQATGYPELVITANQSIDRP